MAQILIVEDDTELSEGMRSFLESAGYDVECVGKGGDALLYMGDGPADLILVDLLLPDMGGMELCGKIRDVSDCPVIYVSRIADSEAIVMALESGGDDYLVKPIDYDQLLARIHAKLRRIGGALKKEIPVLPAVIQFKQFTLDINRHKVMHYFRGGVREILLSPTEYSLLVYMSENPGRLLMYSELYENVWDCASLGDVRTVMVHVSNLRKKIDLRQAGIITSVRGAGYIFSDV